MCTDSLAPEARVAEVTDRVWDPAAPAMAKDPLGVAVPSDQGTGVAALPPGRLSVRTTPVAWPGPEFWIVTVWPMPVPADPEVASAALVTWMAGHCTTMPTGPAELSVR